MIQKLKEAVVRIQSKLAAVKLPKPKLSIKMPRIQIKAPALPFKKFSLRRAFMQTTGGVALAGAAVSVVGGATLGLTATHAAMQVSQEAKACLDATKKNLVCAPEGQRALDIQRDTIGKMFASIAIMGVGGMGGAAIYGRTQTATARATQPKAP